MIKITKVALVLALQNIESLKFNPSPSKSRIQPGGLSVSTFNSPHSTPHPLHEPPMKTSDLMCIYKC